MSFSGLGKVLSNEKTGPEQFLMVIHVPELAGQAKPGQFVHVRVNDVSDPLLRRPVSLYDIDRNAGTVSLLYQVVGRGTELLSGIPAGAEVDVMGPLGNGFWIPEGIQKVLVVGGGIGNAPLFPLVRELKFRGVEQTVLLGGRTADLVAGLEGFKSLGVTVETATDDGSIGRKGFVTQLAEDIITLNKHDYFFACGPGPMLKQLIYVTGRHGIRGQVSLEERMGCGVGACLACVCKIKAETDDSGWDYKKVCVDGPVFEAGEVIIDG
ncbi:MAG TPA: dihydroorotate dehydrogenase electron transfer subunit [Verrucomicrobiae bacterium]|nr:dihydroorotate dehydrogenase electron transfer subunit [Verrucomicrobiae bacterium]